MSLRFTKMHGLGNDFVILDGRHQKIPLNETFVRRLSERRLGIGCDQLIVLSEPSTPEATVRMQIFNADGGEVGVCGNASRCVSWLLAREGYPDPVLETIPGLLKTKAVENNQIQVDMGVATTDWEKIPLREPLTPKALTTTFETVIDPVAVNIGNPHIIFFVKDLKKVDIQRLGVSLSNHPLFPHGTNVEVAQVADFKTLAVKVWERGTGVTPACGSGACASVFAAHEQGLVDRRATVHLEGGQLSIEVCPDNHVLMTGPVQLTFEGMLEIPVGQ